jgi:hypothetical protein
VLALALLAVPAAVGAAEPEYVLEGHQWHHDDLTWSLRGDPTGPVTPSQASTAIQAALDTWAGVTPLTFTQVADCEHGAPGGCDEPDLRVWFTRAPHDQGDGDTEFGTGYGHAIYPGNDDGPGLAGDIHLDNAATWYVNGRNVPDIQSIVAHESGHALGLRHATACPNRASPTRPIMCSLILGVQRTLAPDDVQGIQAIYGRPEHLIDSTVRRNIDRSFVGNDIVNTNSRGQSVTFTRARGQRAIFFVRVTNDGTGDDVVRLRAPTAPAGFGYAYYAGASGRTPATGITQGTYQVSLGRGAGATVRIVVTVKAGAVRHRSQALAVRATSLRDTSRVDVVRPVVKVS